jgi:hypothetical protein
MTAPLSTQELREAKLSHIHPKYSAESGQNDIALIVTDPIEFNDFTVPACLWYNTTHLPFELRKIVFDRSGIRIETILENSNNNAKFTFRSDNCNGVGHESG